MLCFRALVGLSILSSSLLIGCNDPAVQSPTAQDEAAPAPAAEEKRPNLVKRKTKVVLDKNKAMSENPNLVVTENRVSGNDPLTTVLTGYISAASQINVMNMKHQIDLMKAADDRYPTYDEFMAMMAQHNLELNALPDYQNYAYDDKTGEFVILEDPEAKAAFYEQAK